MLDYDEIGKSPQIIMKLYNFINKYNWYGINYPSDDWLKFEKINSTIAINVLYEKEKEICPANISKYNSTLENQIILLLIPNANVWDYLGIKNLSALLRGITPKHHGDFYCLNCLHSFATNNKLKSHEKVCKNKDFCGIVLPTQKNDVIQVNQYMKSEKLP